MNKTTRRLYIPAAILLASFLCVSTANAQGDLCPYTLNSLQGKYAIVVTYLPTFAAVAIGTRYYDGAGNLIGAAPVNTTAKEAGGEVGGCIEKTTGKTAKIIQSVNDSPSACVTRP